ncbi:DUF4403 family protein [Arundinibacter roseus]|uniref:DUF4403 family protein n=2 Tax=Arundinibacter roseus TaxID=2070510 RepID=A0A4R4JS87_9BACT|nr:DUF4403 family protein [Arundinibacter roseus]
MFAGLLATLLLTECRPKTTETPKAPKESYLYSDMEIQEEKQLSVVNIPVEMPVSELEKQLNAQLNGLIYEDNSYENDQNDNLKAKVWKLSPIKVQALDSTFLFDVPLKVWVSAGYKISPLGVTMSGYKDSEFSLRIRFISKISVTPDWQLSTHTYVDSYDWIKEPEIKVAGLSIPIKSMVSRTLNRNFDKITKAIDEQVGSTIELKKYVQQAWETVHRPVLLSEEYNTWLLVVPTGLMMSPLLVKNNIMRTTIGIQGYTQTVTSSEKPVMGATPRLPALQTVEKMPGEFKIGLISKLPYAEATRLAQKKFIGEKFSFSEGKYQVEVTGLDLYGQNENLVIKANLKGSLNGIIYLKGKPYYDPVTKNLSLKNLDYDLETKNVILKTAGWLLQSKFSKMMEQQFVFPIGQQIAETQAVIQKNLTHNTLTKGIILNGKINEIEPHKVYLTPEHLYSVVFAGGQVTLRVEGLQ